MASGNVELAFAQEDERREVSTHTHLQSFVDPPPTVVVSFQVKPQERSKIRLSRYRSLYVMGKSCVNASMPSDFASVAALARVTSPPASGDEQGHDVGRESAVSLSTSMSRLSTSMSSVRVEELGVTCCYPCRRRRHGKKNLAQARAALRFKMMASKQRCQRDSLGTALLKAEPVLYNWSISTRDNYQCPPASPERGQYTVPFAAYRAAVDAEYHGYYTLARQGVQDELIQHVVDMTQSMGHARPWVTFTAGAMGAGKSRTMTWLSDNGIFPLSEIVQIDPDLFKTALPEWDEYVSKEPMSAGFHTRQESGLLCEIAQEAAMRLNKHLWVDGSLRDSEWYTSVFEGIRQRYPAYRIAIIHVVADDDIVYERARKRAAATGRHVPESEILDSLRRVPAAVEKLSPLADFVATIDNSTETPGLRKWEDNQEPFRPSVRLRYVAPADFPEALKVEWGDMCRRLRLRATEELSPVWADTVVRRTTTKLHAALFLKRMNSSWRSDEQTSDSGRSSFESQKTRSVKRSTASSTRCSSEDLGHGTSDSGSLTPSRKDIHALTPIELLVHGPNSGSTKSSRKESRSLKLRKESGSQGSGSSLKSSPKGSGSQDSGGHERQNSLVSAPV